jgi:predicted DNA binding CopG/RHH family protein
LTDFEDQLEEVNEPVFESRTDLNIHLDPDETEAVRQMARSKGISYVELVREWVLEKIHVK